MKGYKGFGKGLICRGKQYAENAVFEEETAEICKSGMHFCKNPLDVLEYYPLIDANGNMSEFAEVESLDETYTHDGEKYCAKKLKVGAKISFAQLVQASIEFESEKTHVSNLTSDKNARINSAGDEARINSAGYEARINSAGDWVRVNSAGDWARVNSASYEARINSAGYGARISSAGNWARINSAGDEARISSAGKWARINSAGYEARINSAGDWVRVNSAGDEARINSASYEAQINSAGYEARISSSGDWARINSAGYEARISSSGDSARIKSTGKNSVICCPGHGCRASAKIGSWITLAEWGPDGIGEYKPLCVKTEYVDGERIKEGVMYKLENGEFKEAGGE